MLEKLVEAAIVLVVISGLSFLLGAGISEVIESSLRKRQESAGLRERMQRMALLVQRFQARKEKMLPRLVKLDAEIKSARRRHYIINKKVMDFKVDRSRLMRVLGEEDGFLRTERPARKFIASIINRHVQRAQLDQKEHPSLSRAWARTQQVVIWASTIGDAKALAERSFAPATGFFVTEISEPGGDSDEKVSAFEATEMSVISRERNPS